MDMLENFYITDNHIFGNLNETFCQRPSDFAKFEALEADCLDEEVTCDCCTTCCDDTGHCCNYVEGTCGPGA